MKKHFLFAFMVLVSVVMMAQNDEYPVTRYEYSYPLDGVQRSNFSTGMVKRVAALEAAQTPAFTMTVHRWYSSGFGEQGYGYDTIASYIYEKGKAVKVEDARLSDDEYKEFVWSLTKETKFTSAVDSTVAYTFNYSSSNILSYYTQADTSYTAYAGRPYNLQTVENPLQLPLTYTSSDEKVATVDSKGWITVAGKGETMIKASFAGNDEISAKSAEWKLVVKEGDHYTLSILSKERSEHTWGSGGSTYLAFDMIPVTEANCNDIYGDGSLSFDIATRTLTMNNFQRIFTEDEDISMGWMDWLDYESGPLPLNIRIIGNCAIRHNSAGFFGGWDMNIIGNGEQNSRLTMEGRFPQFSVANLLTIDGVQVHALASTPHPLMMCNTLRVENDSYFEAHMDMSDSGDDFDPVEAGAMVAQVENVEMGDHIAMLTKDVHIAMTNNGYAFVDGNGRIALRVEIGPKMENSVENVTFLDLELTDDPTGTEKDGVLYTLTNADTVDPVNGCLVISSTVNVDDMDSIVSNFTPGSAAFAEAFDGICFLVPAGKGKIELDMQTTGNYQLAVQLGKNQPTLLTKSEKGIVSVNYDLQMATFAYIYAVVSSPATAPAVRRINTETQDGSVRLYSIKLTDTASCVENMLESQSSSAVKVVRNGQILILHNGKTYNALGTELK